MHIKKLYDGETFWLQLEGIAASDGSVADPDVTDVQVEVLDRSKGRPYTKKKVSIFPAEMPREWKILILSNILEASRDEFQSELGYEYQKGAE